MTVTKIGLWQAIPRMTLITKHKDGKNDNGSARIKMQPATKYVLKMQGEV